MRFLTHIFISFTLFSASCSDVNTSEPNTPQVRQGNLSLVEQAKSELAVLELTFNKQDQALVIVKQHLEQMSQRDAMLREYQSQAFMKRESDPKSLQEIWKLTRDSDVSNALQLHAIIDRYGWIDAKRFGEKAEQNAWLISQHMVHDQGKFQRYVLQKMSKSSNYNNVNYALLSDRVNIIFDKEPQQFGSQGKCLKSGLWEPSAIDKKEELDDRRKAIGLKPFFEYSNRMSEKCAAQTKN